VILRALAKTSARFFAAGLVTFAGGWHGENTENPLLPRLVKPANWKEKLQ